MKLSLDWLSDFVDFSVDGPPQIAESLTLGCAEVEEVEEQGKLLDKCVVGKVLTIEDHPNADKLKLCDIETGKGTKRVVCGGTNIRKGMLVAFAHIGANVKWHGEEMIELKKTKIRGEESEGMICAAEELELSLQFPEADGRHIIDMGDEGYRVGKSLKEALGLGDTIFHIDNHSITHRADLFSHVGFARECIALGLGTWKKKLSYSPPSFASEPVPFKCVVDRKELVPRYLACTLEIESIGETPDWMKRRLLSVGIRSLNLPVDITNYVAAEVGMPLHSFDLDDLKGDVHFRTAKKGEKIMTLDSQERVLPEGAIVLSDSEGIFDLMGVMGGLRSSTKETTRNIYLHSAVLDPISIRNTIIAIGHRTDASTVYEKGIPRITAENGLYRALELFLELVPGAKITSALESHGNNGEAAPIQLSLAHASSYLGRELSQEEVKKALTSLDFAVESAAESRASTSSAQALSLLRVTPPLHRLGDISETVDVIEEIARIIGFESFVEEMPEASIKPPKRDNRLSHMRQTLKEAGFTEVVRFAFLGEELLQKTGLEVKHLEEIENPLGKDLRYMQPSLLPRLLECAEENIRLVDEELRIFEVGHVFNEKKEAASLAFLIASKRKPKLNEEPLLLAKSVIMELCNTLELSCSFEKEKKVTEEKHPARSSEILVGKENVGFLFEVHPSVAKNFNVKGRIAVATLDLEAIFAESRKERVYKELSEFPAIVYDTTISLDSSAEVGSLLKKARGAQELLQDIELADLYQKGVKCQLTFRCTYSAHDRTLTEEEVKPVHEKVEAMLRS